MRTFLARVFLAVVAAISIAFGTANAQTSPPPGPPQLPPGMTQEIMNMLMTPGKLNPPGLPSGLLPLSGCVPTMGFHYAKDGDFPFGPLYGWYDGKPIFTEIMPTVAQFEAGFNTDDIKPLPGYKIDHVDVWYEAHGHKGLLVPHYDIHAWYVSHEEHMKYCNNPSGKRPPYL